MTLLLVGSNYRTAPLELRERLYLDSSALDNVLQQLHHHSENIMELAIISTCNRFEVYVVADNLLSARSDIVNFMCAYFSIAESDLLDSIYYQIGELAIRHMMDVSAGLDSMVLGEAQILGQVTAALEYAVRAGTTGTILHRLFESAIHTGKRARTETAISQHTTSISHAAALLMRQQSAVSDPKVLILGAGQMAELAVFAFHKYKLSHIGVVNRSYNKAKALASKYGVYAHSWDSLEEELQDADVLVTATGAPHVLIEVDMIRTVMHSRPDKDLILIDIAVPRNIAAETAQLDGIQLFDIDSLQHIVDNSLAAREACIPQVEDIIKDESTRFQEWLKVRAVVPLIKDLRQEVALVVENELNEAINKIPELSDAGVEVVKRMAHRITNKVLYAPTKNLRAHASNSDIENYTAMVRELFALDSDKNDDCRYV
ncbi:MAG: glutamyl-tRNA reductase [Phototrophicaceae bacterium]